MGLARLDLDYLESGATEPRFPAFEPSIAQLERLIPHYSLLWGRPPQRAVSAWLYGAGTLMTVFTMVTDAPRDSTLPLMVVICATPAVETEAPCCAMMVPTIVPPPRLPLIVAADRKST